MLATEPTDIVRGLDPLETPETAPRPTRRQITKAALREVITHHARH
ncbi:MAG TPA: hypothetical protein VGN81_16445 [Pseudonocardiaceae bacterium]|jgi:hypothetical protein